MQIFRVFIVLNIKRTKVYDIQQTKIKINLHIKLISIYISVKCMIATGTFSYIFPLVPLINT